MKTELCPYSTFIISGSKVMLLCNFTNSGCAVTRWCISDNCFKMTDKYPSGCKYVNKEVHNGI
jgi:hypothetical protein